MPAGVAAHVIQGICGRTYFESSVPLALPATDLLSSWENRLVARAATVGSTECALIWRKKLTPRGLVIFRLARSTRLSNATACGGSLWPAPVAGSESGPDFGKAARSNTGHRLETVMVGTALWPAPQARDGNTPKTPKQLERQRARSTRLTKGGPPGLSNLNDKMMHVALWVAPQARDGKGSRAPNGAKAVRPGGPMLNEQMVETADRAMWGAPTAHPPGGTADAFLSRKRKARANGKSLGISLTDLGMQMTETSALWAAPTVHGNFNVKGMSPTSGDGLGTQMRGATARGGRTANGSSATTAKRGAPNPAFPCWLMGCPDEWLRGVLSAMQSRRSSRRKSLPRSSKPK